MAPYRELFVPEDDQTAEALDDISRTMRRLRTRALVPSALLSVLAGVWLHVSDFLDFARALNGGFLIDGATVVVYTMLAAAAVAVPCFILYRVAVVMVGARWQARAPAAFRISAQVAAECVAMFR